MGHVHVHDRNLEVLRFLVRKLELVVVQADSLARAAAGLGAAAQDARVATNATAMSTARSLFIFCSLE